MNTAAHCANNTAIFHSVMNTAAHIGHCSTAHCDWLLVHISLSRPEQLQNRLGFYSKIAYRDDTCHALTTFKFVLVHHPHLQHQPDSADITADFLVVPYAAKLLSPPAPTDYATAPLNPAP